MTKKDTLTARFTPLFLVVVLFALFPVLQTILELPSVATGQSRAGQQEERTQKKRQNGKRSREEDERSDQSAVTVGFTRPVLWRDPVNLERRDLFDGPGGDEGAPHPAAKYTFIKHSKGGTQKKIIVKDNFGREWTVKFGPEARPETVATRIVWAVGYHADQDYFVRRAYIGGKETFDARDVRFERRDDGYKEIGNWSWKDNPLAGTRELDGLKVLMALLKNWDLKKDNNEIARHERNGQIIYYVADLGASLGRTGSFWNKIPIFADIPPDKFGGSKSKGHPEAFAEEKFISKVRDGKVVFHFERSRGRSILKEVPVQHARWMGNLLARLSHKQLSDAFRAGGFNEPEVAMYVRTMRGHINQLQNLDRLTEVSRR